MNIIVRKKIETLCDICAAIENSPVGRATLSEPNVLKQAALLQLGQFLMFLAASDGNVSYAEAKFISESIPLFSNWLPMQFTEHIRSANIYSKDFENAPPILLQLMVTVDNEFYKNGQMRRDNIPSILESIYRQIGQEFMDYAGSSFRMQNDFDNYMHMFIQYMSENMERPLNKIYHSHEINGESVDVVTTIGPISIKWEDDDSICELTFGNDDDDLMPEEILDKSPVISIPGKKFVFTGMGVQKDELKKHPLVNQVIAKGGLFRGTVSGVTDYLVLGDQTPSDSVLKAAISQREAGKSIQIISTEALQAALQAGKPIRFDHETGAKPLPYLPDGTEPEFTIENGVLTHIIFPYRLMQQEYPTVVIPEGVTQLASHCLIPKGYTTDDSEIESFFQELEENCHIIYLALPSTLKKINDFAFSTNESFLFSVTELPAMLEEIGTRALDGYWESVVLPPSLRKIGKHAFGTDGPSEITIQNPGVQIACQAFGMCKKRKMTLHIPRELAHLEQEYASLVSELKIDYIHSQFSIPVPNQVFFDIKDRKLVSVYLPPQCRQVVLPEGIETLDDCVFYGSMLESITLPASLKKINYGSIANCRHLSFIRIPEGVKEIEWGAFDACSKIKALYLPSTLSEPFVPSECFGLEKLFILGEPAPSFIDSFWNSFSRNKGNIKLYLPQQMESSIPQEALQNNDIYILSERERLSLIEENSVLSSLPYSTEICGRKVAPQKSHVPQQLHKPTAQRTSRGVPNHAAQSAKKEGCYIATAVYGSYDAPQVKVLRRFRDETLQKTAPGRWFIRAYYRLSPAIAEKLRNAQKTNRIVRKFLDRWVKHLKAKY